MRGYQKVHCRSYYQDQLRSCIIGERKNVSQQIKHDSRSGEFRWGKKINFLEIFFINLGFLFQILKREWPKNWESFIPDIIGASKTNESLCQNNMIILKLLSEEVFDFSTGQMTQTKAKHLKDTMCSQFSEVFTLCQFVMENSQNPPLVGATLETLLRFLNWIPLGTKKGLIFLNLSST